ncbi:DMT family transporter [Vibrio gallaecicus]|uniref:DMT family transporter n=1 Tax=Vibrio gallaecicus TaxID=552386 RepID=UPI0010C9EE5E|nr:DMT family transporter [Vibrio gallaecicus]MDN3615304.1 DMT family transporter [Vibrio gallaecicus]
MSNITIGILLLVAGNFFASLSDVAVKALQGDVQPFQYMFIRQLFSLVLITPLWLKQTRTQKKLQQKSITLIRAHLILIGSGCMVMAITYLPLATANAVFYTAPLLMLPLSFVLLNEKPAAGKVLATIIGFFGVLIVLRPSQFHWAALFALGTACTLALFNILVRKLPKEQTVITTLWWTTILSLPTSFLLTAGYWQPISHTNIAYVALSAALILGYNGLAVLAYKKAHSSEIALAEYSGLIFVALFGVLWFDEIPDWITLIGILLIVLPLIPFKKRKKS